MSLKKLSICLLLATSLVLPCSAEDLASQLNFNDSGVIVNSAAEKTFSFPDITSGAYYDFNSNQISPCLSIELFESHQIVSDVGVGVNTLYGTIGYNFIPIYDIHAFAFLGYNFNSKEPAYGIGFGILKF